MKKNRYKELIEENKIKKIYSGEKFDTYKIIDRDYELNEYKDGTYSCTCPAFSFKKECVHIKARRWMKENEVKNESLHP